MGIEEVEEEELRDVGSVNGGDVDVGVAAKKNS